MTEKKHGWQHSVPALVPEDYEHYCWFVYPAIDANGKNLGTVKSLFPPMGRNKEYGDKTETEIRSLAFGKLNELQKQYGAANVKVISIDEEPV